MKIGSNSVEENTYSLIKKSLDASLKRNEVIDNNISNVNTKGFKRHYVTFEETLKDTQSDMDMTTTNEKHISDGKEYGQIEEQRDESDSMRMDGNNVDIENEMANLAANSLKYNALISQMNSRISMKRNIINGGK
ncbi:flagellar basal body rod protein FlgB [Clostridium sp. MB40-C1]|uniref:flagellar basal body rod protein FlgB n=1 Tax=Clostridium sp. MB40-C1 TaxID=3070996 RepID=UPI0027E01AB6|nr:flagellar basal body rod protein FlgB [Clostridium sp. MB40-C1]WMJ81331.1 flagellar basal body rod protein FlgB [Clostridium sp. MB40-C1]